MRILFIVNPISGRGAGERAIPLIQNFIDQNRLTGSLIVTQFAGHAIEIASQKAKDFDIIVATGGDGTSNEVLNGLMQAKSQGQPPPALAVLSVGRGNDFAFGIGVPKGLNKGFDVLLNHQLKSIDIGLIQGGDYPQGRFFGNGVGIGFDAVVGFVAARSRLTGFLSYIVAAIKTAFIYFTAPLLELQFDHKAQTVTALMVSVMNGRRMGGGFMMTPHSLNNDGLFDVCIAKEVPKAQIFALIPHFIRGTQLSQKSVYLEQTKTLQVTAIEGSLPIHADGETICTEGKSVSIQNIPNALQVVVPK
ncbi:MAG: Transcription regulator [contains diacylglycerol kinase catalytic domain] [Anaerolineae bacterium]|jgi:YegS/Rv2252/BmrU family lipid kinase|nr:MAG: Transcription regulator [contains diacylglycerol kinase catalytic domain] [Anaerolineae bacterium]